MTSLEKHFSTIGAKLDLRHVARLGGRDTTRTFDLDVQGRGRNEHFVLRVTPRAPEFQVLQANKAARHLLLLAKDVVRAAIPARGLRLRPNEVIPTERVAERFLCGHDERHWFAASIARPVSTIMDARRALLPRQFADLTISPGELVQRHGPRFKRQGEWFFVPAEALDCFRIERCHVHRSEPLVRPGGGKPHLVAELVRFGGVPVYATSGREYSMDEWQALTEEDRKKIHARFFIKDPEVYVRGPIRHPDHATLILPDWHKVYVNGEIRSGSLSFYD